MVATSRLYVTVSYGSCMVAASDLYSTISQQNKVLRTSACGCLNWAGSISFVRTFQEVTSGFLRFLFCFVFVDVGNRTNVTSLIGFFCTRHILAKFGALRARSFNSRARSLFRNRSRSLHVRACMCM